MKNEKQRTVLLLILVVAILTITVAYAALSTSLRINSSATVRGASWDIHFSGGSVNGTPTSAPAEGRSVYFDGVPTLSTTTISNVRVVLTQPSDSATYSFNIVNNGSIDARLSTLTSMTPTCSPSGTDATKACTYISRTLTYTSTPTYENGVTYNGTKIVSGAAVTANDVIPAGQTVSVNLTIGYADGTTSENFPSSDVSVSYPEQTLVFIQD